MPESLELLSGIFQLHTDTKNKMLVNILLLKNIFCVTGAILRAEGTQKTRGQTLFFKELIVLGGWTDTLGV